MAAADQPSRAANLARNARGSHQNRRRRWRPARNALWKLVDGYVDDGARVAVVGAGNGDDVPLGRLAQRAGHLDLIDLDGAALARARARAGNAANVRALVQDITAGAADAIVTDPHRAPRESPSSPEPLGDGPYDVVIADLVLTQLLYPALVDAGRPGKEIDTIMVRHGQPLTDAVVARLHASAPGGIVVHVHDLLGWWRGHDQPVALKTVLELTRDDRAAAIALAHTGNVPLGCDPRAACRARGAPVLETALWRWPFARGVDYLVCATVAGPANPDR